MAFLLSLILELELQYYLNNETQLTKLSKHKLIKSSYLV